jgi:hypothetical protein
LNISSEKGREQIPLAIGTLHYVICHFLLAQKVTIPIDREALFAKKLFLLLFSGKSNQCFDLRPAINCCSSATTSSRKTH